MTASTTSSTEPDSQTGHDAEQASLDWIDRLAADAGGDDTVLLALIEEHLAVVRRHGDRVRETRAEAIVRLRAGGMSNIQLQQYTGLSDSGVSRAALAAGAPRRVNRRGEPPERRTGPADRREPDA